MYTRSCVYVKLIRFTLFFVTKQDYIVCLKFTFSNEPNDGRIRRQNWLRLARHAPRAWGHAQSCTENEVFCNDGTRTLGTSATSIHASIPTPPRDGTWSYQPFSSKQHL